MTLNLLRKIFNISKTHSQVINGLTCIVRDGWELWVYFFNPVLSNSRSFNSIICYQYFFSSSFFSFIWKMSTHYRLFNKLHKKKYANKYTRLNDSYKYEKRCSWNITLILYWQVFWYICIEWKEKKSGRESIINVSVDPFMCAFMFISMWMNFELMTVYNTMFDDDTTWKSVAEEDRAITTIALPPMIIMIIIIQNLWYDFWGIEGTKSNQATQQQKNL